MEPGAEQIPALKALKAADRKAFDAAWKSIREDGAYIEAGENDNVIVQKLEANPNALGIFGYSFLEENGNRIKAAAVNGVKPTAQTIASGQYPVSRSLYIYVKKANVGVTPGLKDFLAEFVSDAATGRGGYLQGRGLILLPPAQHQAAKAAASQLTQMAPPKS